MTKPSHCIDRHWRVAAASVGERCQSTVGSLSQRLPETRGEDSEFHGLANRSWIGRASGVLQELWYENLVSCGPCCAACAGGSGIFKEAFLIGHTMPVSLFGKHLAR